MLRQDEMEGLAVRKKRNLSACGHLLYYTNIDIEGGGGVWESSSNQSRRLRFFRTGRKEERRHPYNVYNV